MHELSAVEVILSIILTWIIGLLPPYLVRYVLIKRPIAKWPAIGVCIFFWLCNFIFFTALGSKSKSHAALYFIAWVSYLILRRESKKTVDQPIQMKEDLDSVPTHSPDSVSTYSKKDSVEAQLTELKSLHEKGLVTDDVYKELQNEILRGK